MRAIDFHVHLPTPDWMDGSMAGYIEPAEAYFRAPAQRTSLDELADRYQALNARALLLAWDAETATGRPRLPNETVAEACRRNPRVFVGFGSIDPHKGPAAIAELDNIAALGLRGVKFHPSLQAFAPDDEAYWPIFAACQQHGLAALFHTGTSGMGAGQPGGQGIRLDYARPIRLDAVAVACHRDGTGALPRSRDHLAALVSMTIGGVSCQRTRPRPWVGDAAAWGGVWLLVEASVFGDAAGG